MRVKSSSADSCSPWRQKPEDRSSALSELVLSTLIVGLDGDSCFSPGVLARVVTGKQPPFAGAITPQLTPEAPGYRLRGRAT
jgi:hypothetical protein